MPRYVLEIREPDGSITYADHETPGLDFYDIGHIFDADGRKLRVVLLEDMYAPYDQKLICTPA